MRILAVVNQKGGCGKTTTAINLSGVFARRGFKTLLVDMDPQGHCAAGLAIPEQRVDQHIGDAMLAPDNAPVDPERLLWRVSRNLDLAPSTVRLAALEAARGELAKRDDAETRLKKVLDRFDSQYDACIIDCSPAIGMLAFNALVAAHEVLIPVETGFFSLQGATKQVNAIKAIGKRLGVAPMHRLLATMHDPSSVLSQDLLEELRRRFGNRVLPVVIRADQSLREAASFGQPVIEYSPESNGAKDYAALADWLMENSLKLGSQRTTEPDEPDTAGTGTPTVQVVPGIGDRTGLGTSHRPPVPAPSMPHASSPLAAAKVIAVQPTPAAAHVESNLNPSRDTATAVAVQIAPVATPPSLTLPTSRAADIAGRTRTLKRAAAIAEVKSSPILATEPLGSISLSTLAPSSVPQQSSAEPVTPALMPASFRATTSPTVSLPVPSSVLPESAAPTTTPRPFGVQTRNGLAHFCQPVSIGQSVAIAGEFNDWNPERTPMRPNPRTGMLEAEAPVSIGSWQYRLVVDGRWMPDPFNPVVAPNPYGGSNSVVFVPHSS